MARSLNMAVLAAILLVAAALVQSSRAQTYHTVGDSMGWLYPPAVAYSAWANQTTFTVGDSLVFNFTTGSHDVAKVTKADYDACTTTNPILLENTGPATIKLNATGEHFFICNYTGHCSGGQKLAINVSAATTASPSPAPSTRPSATPSPAPPTSTTTPASAPSPAPVPSSTPPTPSSAPPTSAPPPSPSSSAVTYIVGDISKNWTVPAPNTTYYQTWAANKSFKVGDILVFNYDSGRHDVAVVTKEAYESCSATNATTIALYSTPPTTITLNTSGEHFFICNFTQHCPLGQKLAINVTSTTTAPSPSPSGSPFSPPPISPATPPSSSASNTPPPSSSSTPPSEPSPSGGSSPPPPPPPSSGASLGVAGVCATLLSILVALYVIV